jgi:response regulator RpfG family c-di-GMP phosphodiesterase
MIKQAARERIAQGRGRHYDADVVDAFLALLVTAAAGAGPTERVTVFVKN